MLRNRESIITVCEVLAEQENLKATFREVMKGAAITGVGALLGGLLGGPPGLAIGGTLASVATAVHTRGRYRSVVDILRNDLTPAQQRKLETAVKRILSNIQTEDVAALLALLATKQALKEVVIEELSRFLLQELNMNMIR